MNSGNSKNSDLHSSVIHLAYKIDLKRSDKYVAFSNLSIYNEQTTTIILK